jgi:hypothetical protein
MRKLHSNTHFYISILDFERRPSIQLLRGIRIPMSVLPGRRAPRHKAGRMCHQATASSARAENKIKKGDFLEQYPHFQTSRWFTGDWTLPELVAQGTSYSTMATGRPLRLQVVAGDIARFTSIPSSVLLYAAPNPTAWPKMKWSSKRRRRSAKTWPTITLDSSISTCPVVRRGDKAFEWPQEETQSGRRPLSVSLARPGRLRVRSPRSSTITSGVFELLPFLGLGRHQDGLDSAWPLRPENLDHA